MHTPAPRTIGLRTTEVTYPDGTFETYTYDKLDLASYQDRQSWTWTYSHDNTGRVTAVTFNFRGAESCAP